MSGSGPGSGPPQGGPAAPEGGWSGWVPPDATPPSTATGRPPASSGPPGYPPTGYPPPYPAPPYAAQGYPAQGYPAPYPAPGYPPPYPAPGYPAPAPSPSRAPREAWQERPYPQALRGPRHRWWRSPLGLAVVGGLVLSQLILFGVVGVLVEEASGGPISDAAYDAWQTGPWGVLVLNLLLASFVPITLFAVWAAHRWPPGYLSSVGGRLRWRWLAVTVAVAVALWVPVSLLTAVWDPPPWDPEPRWPLLVAVVLLTTPLQAAGEEYLFRGWLTQAIGCLVPRATVGAVLAGVVSATLFAFAHGEQNPWLFGDRFVFGAVASWLVWRTGGLEAGIALHVVNNLVAFGFALSSGELAESLQVTEADPVSVLVDVALLLVAAVVVDLVARRRKVRRRVPAAVPVGVLPGGGPASGATPFGAGPGLPSGGGTS